MATHAVNGTTLNVEERGDRGAPALVLLHGFPLDNRVWDAQRSALSDRYRVIAPDLRGFGKSAPSGPFTLETLADDVHALLGRLGALPCVLGGLSMGGYVALAYAKKYPQDLRGLVLVDTRAEGDTPEGRENRNKMIESAKTGGSKAVAEQMLPKMTHPLAAHGSPWWRADVVGRIEQIMLACSPRTIQHALAAMRDREDYRELLPSIAVPTLILVGDSDAITPPAMAEAMREQIPGAKLEEIPSAGHMTPIESPEAVNAAIRTFLDELDRR